MNNDTILQAFEWYLKDDGTHWNHLKALAPSFSDMGITCAWLPPAYKGAAGSKDVGYGVYDMYDLGEFNQKGTVRTKYGTKEEYLACVKKLQKYHIAVIADIVFNHRMGADGTEKITVVEENPTDRQQDISSPEQIESWTKFTFPGRKGKYSTFTFDHTCFDGTDWDEEGHHSAIYRIADKKWDADVDQEDGNYDYLMGCDLDLSSEKVRKECSNWGHWYMDTVHPDAFRLDAVKHICWHFIDDWLNDMRAYSHNPDLFAVGEYWNGNIDTLLKYLDENNNCMSLFDVCLHYKLQQASDSNGFFDMGSLFNDTLVSRRPMNAVTFVDNHDTQPGQALQSFVEGWFKPIAYALILMKKDGLPCIFYGDLYGIPHDQIQPVKNLARMIRIRYDYAYGEEYDWFDDQNIVGFTRNGDNEHPDSGLAVIGSDGPGGIKKMNVGKEHAGEIWVDALENQKQEIRIDESGNAPFTVDGGSVSIYLKKEAAAKISKIPA